MRNFKPARIARSVYFLVCVVGACVAFWQGLPIWVPALLLLIGVAQVLSFQIPWLRDEAQSERNRASLYQLELDRQQQVIDGLIDGLDVAIFVCSAQGQVEYANRAATQMFEFKNPVGQSILAVTLAHAIVPMVGTAAEKGESSTRELFLRSGQVTAVVRTWPEPVQKERVFVSLIDITHLRHLERVRTDFVANVSHELRTPLANIRAMTELIQEETESQTELSQRYSKQIIKEIDRLASIVSDLLVLTTAETKTLDKEPVAWDKVVADVLDSLESKSKSKGLRLNREISEDAMVSGDPIQLAQTVFNLVDNAISYTSEGFVQVKLHREGQDWLLQVQDSGIGIPIEHQARIFERFYRADRSRSRDSGGTGLGLAIVKHIVEAHGGRIEVESLQNRGSTFTVSLPALP